MKQFIKTIIVSLILIFLAHYFIFDFEFTEDAISNAIFLVGIMMFFLGLMLITNAPRIFMIFTYSVKQVFSRKNFPYKSFYDYYAEKEKDPVTPYAVPILVMSIIYLGISLILAYMVLQGAE